MSRPCRQTLLEGTSLQSKQTNKERKQERKQQQQQQIVAPLQLSVFSNRQETPWLAHDRVLVRRQPMLHYIHVFLRKQRSQQYLLPLSLSALGSSNTYSSNLRGIPVQSGPIGCYCRQAKAEMTIIMTIFIIIHYLPLQLTLSSQNRTEQTRTEQNLS